MSSNKRRKVTAARKYPINELFKHWLEDLKDQVASYGGQAQFTYGKAVKSISKCPIALNSAEEAKGLENIGEKIVALLAKKLEKFKNEHGEPTFDNIHLAGVEVENADDDAEDAIGDQSSPKKRVKRKSREYIPGIRTGGYAIIRALYDAYVDHQNNGFDAMPFVEKRELQQSAQRYCNESMTITATQEKPYTAWNSVNTLLKHDLVKMNRAKGSTMQYALTDAGIAMGKRLTDTANGDIGDGTFAPTIFAAASSEDPLSPKPKKKRQPRNKKDPPDSPIRPSTTTAVSANTERPASPAWKDFRPSSPPQSTTSATLSFDSPTQMKAPFLDYQKDNYDGDDYNDDYNDGFYEADYGTDDALASRPLGERISGYYPLNDGKKNGPEIPVELGYVYIDSDGMEARNQDKAYCSIVGDSLWYLVKTTKSQVEKLGYERFRECDDLPSSILDNFIGSSEHIPIYLRSDNADDYAPGIFETSVVYGKPEPIGDSSATRRFLGENDELLAPPNDDVAFDQPETSAIPLDDLLPSTSAMQSPKMKTPMDEFASSLIPRSPKQTDQPSTSTVSASQGAIPPMIILEPGQFEIILVVDHAEVAGGVAMFGEKTKNRKTLLTDGLADQKIDYVKRRLPVGDYLFIARKKAAGIADQELVLGPIIERKRMDDLASSIKDGRFHDQKRRLHSCGVSKVIYLIEDFGKINTAGIDEAALRSAIVGTQICDGFDVIRKKDPREMTKYLGDLLIFLRERFGNKRLISRQPDSPSTLKLIESDSDEIALPTFQEFSELYAKRPVTVGDVFARILLQIPGVSSERAEAIRKIYPTMAHLIEAYETCGGDEEKEIALLQAIRCGQLGRNLGYELSKKIARFFCDKDPFTK